jgi:hypothetical protein
VIISKGARSPSLAKSTPFGLGLLFDVLKQPRFRTSEEKKIIEKESQSLDLLISTYLTLQPETTTSQSPRNQGKKKGKSVKKG